MKQYLKINLNNEIEIIGFFCDIYLFLDNINRYNLG